MKTSVDRVLNLLLWLAFCALAGTGLLLAFRLPPGSRGGAGLSALGMTRHEWGDWHTWIAYAFLALILLHLALHWRWLWKIAAQRKTWMLLAGVGSGLGLFFGWLFNQYLPVELEKNTGQPLRPIRHVKMQRFGNLGGSTLPRIGHDLPRLSAYVRNENEYRWLFL